MSKTLTMLFALLLTLPAIAQEPDEATKIRALKRAYELNGNVMSGWVSLDLSKEDFSVETDPMGPVVAENKPALKKECKRFRRGKCRDE